MPDAGLTSTQPSRGGAAVVMVALALPTAPTASVADSVNVYR